MPLRIHRNAPLQATGKISHSAHPTLALQPSFLDLPLRPPVFQPMLLVVRTTSSEGLLVSFCCCVCNDNLSPACIVTYTVCVVRMFIITIVLCCVIFRALRWTRLVCYHTGVLLSFCIHCCTDKTRLIDTNGRLIQDLASGQESLVELSQNLLGKYDIAGIGANFRGVVRPLIFYMTGTPFGQSPQYLNFFTLSRLITIKNFIKNILHW